MIWSKLKDYCCPAPCCGAPLKQFAESSIHVCSVCDFQISNTKLESITVLKHRKLEPPDFIQEMRNQEELNNL